MFPRRHAEARGVAPSDTTLDIALTHTPSSFLSSRGGHQRGDGLELRVRPLIDEYWGYSASQGTGFNALMRQAPSAIRPDSADVRRQGAERNKRSSDLAMPMFAEYAADAFPHGAGRSCPELLRKQERRQTSGDMRQTSGDMQCDPVRHET